MFDGLVDFLNEHGIEMSHFHRQSYDNEAETSCRYNDLRRYNDLHARVAEQNNLAAWIPCAGIIYMNK